MFYYCIDIDKSNDEHSGEIIYYCDSIQDRKTRSGEEIEICKILLNIS